MSQDFYVYIHRKATTGEVFYVGKGTGDRAWTRYRRSPAWRSTVNKHGLIIEIAQDGLQEWAAFELEQDLIALHGRRDTGDGPLVNFTDGGEGTSGFVFGQESRANVKAAAQARASGPEYRAKHTDAMRKLAENPEWRAKHADAMRKKFEDPEYRAKISDANRKKAADPAIRAKNAEANRKNAADPEFRAKHAAAVRKAFARKVTCIETGMTFDMGLDAAKWLQENGRPRAASGPVSLAARGRIKSAYGYTWRYVDQAAP